MSPHQTERAPDHANWVFQLPEPVLDVEVSLLAAPGAHVDWVHGSRRDEAVRAIVDRCASVFETDINGRIEHVRLSTFNHHGMTVHITITAQPSPQVDEVVSRQLGALERTLEARLQSHFGWEQAAVSVQVEAHPSYINRTSHPNPVVGPVGGITVYQPPGGSNAIAPVIVSVPSAHGAGDGRMILPYPPTTRPGSAAVAGLLGALCALVVALVVVAAIGPLTDEVGALYQSRERMVVTHSADRRVAAAQLHERNRQIAALRQQNATLAATINRLSARRGRQSSRWDQPPTTLPDTGPIVVGAVAVGPGYASADTIASSPASP